MLPGGPPLPLRLARLQQDLHVEPRFAVRGRHRREQLLHALGIGAFAARACEPFVEHVNLFEVLDPLDLETLASEELLPLVLAVRADMRRVTKALGVLLLRRTEERVLHDDEAVRDARHLADGASDVVEMVSGDSRDDDIEGAVRERQILRASDDVRSHPRRRVDGDDAATLGAQAPRNVAAARRDVERLHAAAGLAHVDQRVEIVAGHVRPRRAVALGALRPDVRHPASCTARLAASSIVGSTCRLSDALSARMPRASSAFVPSSRTTIGTVISIRSSASRIPRATSSQRVIPPKMLKRIDRTSQSRAITSSASTTPSASPPPPRSQKFAGVPPATVTTSTVDIARPAPFPRIPTLPSSFTYVTPFSRAYASSGSAAATSRICATSGWRKRALSSTVNFESSAFTSPAGVTISGLISQSIASVATNVSYSFATIEATCFCSLGSSTPAP